MSAIAYGAATLQNAVLRSALRRFQAAATGAASARVATTAGRPIHSIIAGSNTTAITKADPNMAFENP